MAASAWSVLFFGLFGGLDSDGAAASLLGLGAVLMMFGFAFLAPLLVRPLARVLGRADGPLPGPDRACSRARTRSASRSARRSPPRR